MERGIDNMEKEIKLTFEVTFDTENKKEALEGFEEVMQYAHDHYSVIDWKESAK